eukprot:TRINITY_DN1097_c0_g1_i3.p1 TRINITY_DN1097_c0_g1~~TRINITY_DN1097_c0_g1_i3.p1  ORF type:complete len:122 (+),score=30.31 TRINITY_DN1097_c0_g1_i3:103-468(+)
MQTVSSPSVLLTQPTCSTVTCPAGEVCEYIQNANGVFTQCVVAVTQPSTGNTGTTTGTTNGNTAGTAIGAQADCSTGVFTQCVVDPANPVTQPTTGNTGTTNGNTAGATTGAKADSDLPCW